MNVLEEKSRDHQSHEVTLSGSEHEYMYAYAYIYFVLIHAVDFEIVYMTYEDFDLRSVLKEKS